MMDEQTRRDYERAAVALENHEKLVNENHYFRHEPWVAIAWDAFNRALDRVPNCSDLNADDIEGARLLRECLARNEVLK